MHDHKGVLETMEESSHSANSPVGQREEDPRVFFCRL